MVNIVGHSIVRDLKSYRQNSRSIFYCGVKRLVEYLLKPSNFRAAQMKP